MSVRARRVCQSIGGGEKRHKLVVLDLARAILVNVIDQLLDVDRHLELMLNDFNEARGVNRSLLVGLATESDECVEGVFLVAGSLKLLLFCNYLLKLLLGDLASVIGASLGNHAVNLLVARLLAHHLEDDA